MPESLDLMLTDVIMPNMNGRVLHERVAEVHPRIRVVFMSGHPEDVISNHGVLDPGVDFIQKPFSVQDLCTRVRDVLDRGR
jgi:FixJ family two-component response regulator